MDLELDIFRTTGRAQVPVTAEYVRALEPSDFAALGVEKGSKTPAIKRLSERHHTLARNLAGGMPPGQAALICGYDPSRVAILQADPAFRELMTFYREDVDVVYRDAHAKLAGVASTALDELQERLETAPEDISVGQLIELTKLGADRTGYGPQSSQTNVNVNVDLANRLEAARKRVRERTIEG